VSGVDGEKIGEWTKEEADLKRWWRQRRVGMEERGEW